MVVTDEGMVTDIFVIDAGMDIDVADVPFSAQLVMPATPSVITMLSTASLTLLIPGLLKNI
jgi:hypothetical protein